MRFFGAADQHSLYFLANWRKGGVQRSGVFGELIGDACHGRGRGIQFELKNGRLTGNRNLPGARCRSTWSKIRSPAGFDRCSAASRDRAARHNRKLPPHIKVLAVCWLSSAVAGAAPTTKTVAPSLDDFVFARSDFKLSVSPLCRGRPASSWYE